MDAVHVLVLLLLAYCAQRTLQLNSTSFSKEKLTIAEEVAPEEKKSTGDLPLRLPDSLKPNHYLVRLQPFISGNLSFNGFLEITFEVERETDKIILHISDIVTKNETAKVHSMDDPSTMIPIEKQEYNHEKQFYIVTVSEALKKGETYVLSLMFEGFLNDDLKGFYRSSYKDAEGKTKTLATTQFQATDARKAFPCFDEPAFKAKFTIEMIREEGLKTISNMPLIESTPVPDQDGWYLDRFNTTFPMSTYLVAFIVSDFEYLEAENKENYTFRVYAKPNGVQNAKYAVELGPKVSRFYEDFFKVPFPLPKQDMAAVPDFSAGAMENWGLIVYRESAFLYDPEIAKAKDKFRIASIIAHEIAHQWFGDLVTPVWWNDLWLNEGFASYVENIGLRETEPTMRSEDQFLINDLHPAFGLDCLESSHPISIPVENPDDINAIFDTISYSKGASILRMMSNFLTEETFKNGLSKYLTDFSYSNAEQDDLWKYLTDAAHKEGTLDSSMTVKGVMDTWTLQMGFPVISVKRNDDGTATVTQERFLLAKSSDPAAFKDGHAYKWWIPLTFTSQNDPQFKDTKPKVWMAPSESSKVVPDMPEADEWVIFNIGQSGYYRVNYEEDNWRKIAAQLQKNLTVLRDTNRAQVIDDSFNLARAGKLSYETAINLLTYLKNETEFVPIQAALNSLAYIREMLSFTGGYGMFKKYVSSLVIPLYEKVNFTDDLSDPHLEQRKRTELVSWACDLGHQPCVDAAVELFKKWMNSPNDTKLISPNLKSTVYCTAINEGGVSEWKFAWNQYLNSQVGTEQRELLEGMACSNNIWILSELLDRSLSPDKGIKKQMMRYIVPAVTRTDIGKVVAWQFLRNRWGDIVNYFGSVSFVLDDILKSATSSLNTKTQLEEMKMFRETYSGRFSSAARSVEQATEQLKNNIRWLDSYYDVIIQWLEKNGYKNDI